MSHLFAAGQSWLSIPAAKGQSWLVLQYTLQNVYRVLPFLRG